MIVLGIDPGSRKTGYAFIELKNGKFTHIKSGVLNFGHEQFFLDRINLISDGILKILDEQPVDAISMESLIYVKSPTALIKLAQTRGVILSEISKKYPGKIFEYSPNLIKSVAVGHGHADKKSIQKFLSMILGISAFSTSDESDAMAIALCHLLQNPKNVPLEKIEKKTSKSRSLKASLAHKVKGKL